jgi:hypothetical protein
MSNLTRAAVYGAGGIPKLAAGELGSAMSGVPQSLGAASATITAAQMSAGEVYFTGGTTATLTSLTAVQMADAFPELNVGDCITVNLSNQNSGAATIAAGTNVTIVGATSVAAAAKAKLVFRLTSKTVNAVSYQAMSAATQGSYAVAGVPNDPTHSAATFTLYIL